MPHCKTVKPLPRVLSKKEELTSESHSWYHAYEVKKASQPKAMSLAMFTAGGRVEA